MSETDTDLFEAVKKNNVQEAQRIVAAGVSVRCKDEVIFYKNILFLFFMSFNYFLSLTEL